MKATILWIGEIKDEAAAAQLRLLTRFVLGYNLCGGERMGGGGNWGLGILGGGRGGRYWTGKAWEPSLTGAECPGLN